MADLDDPLLFLRPDYLRLMLTYQMVEDYLFQSVYGYLRYGHEKDKNELQNFKTKSLNELKDFFFTTFQVRALSLNEKHYLGRQFHQTIQKRNYYAHEFFSDLYFKVYQEESKTFDEKGLEDLDFQLMDEVNRLEQFYHYLVFKFGPHAILALRNFDVSPKTLSLTHSELPKQQQSEAYAKQREEAFAQNYWNLSYGYFAVESSLYAIVNKLQNHYHFLSKNNAETLEGKSLNEYRKLLIIGVKNDPLVHMVVNDSIPDLSAFAKDITALQMDRNYWLHFCLLGHIDKQNGFDYSAYCSRVDNYNKLSKSLLFCEKTKQIVFRLEDSLGKKIQD